MAKTTVKVMTHFFVVPYMTRITPLTPTASKQWKRSCCMLTSILLRYQIDITGSGKGKGTAAASAKAVATVVASAMAQAFSSAKGGSQAAESAIKTEVSTSGIAQAAANAYVEAESDGESVEVVQEVGQLFLKWHRSPNRLMCIHVCVQSSQCVQ